LLYICVYKLINICEPKKYKALKKNNLPRHFGGFLSAISKLIYLSIILFIAVACEEPDEIGLNLIEDPEDLKSTDLKLTAYSTREDSVPTNYTAKNLLGFLEDPVFGSTKASIYCEFRLREDSLDLGENPVLDSVLLKLYYADKGYYGNRFTPQNIKVYELSENFPQEKSTFYSTFELPFKAQPLADTIAMPLPDDDVPVGEGDTLSPHLRIRLSEEFGQKLIDGSGTEHFANNEKFIEYFKGLNIRSARKFGDLIDRGALLIFDILEPESFISKSTIKLHYHNDEDTLFRLFSPNQQKRATHVEFDRTEAHKYFKKQISEVTTPTAKEKGDSLLFLQSLGGSNIFLDFPELDSLAKEENILLNRAQLIIPVEDSEKFYSEELLPPPDRLYILKNDKEGNLLHITDSNYPYLDGEYDEDKKEYRLNITQHFQEILDDPDSNYGMTLVISDAHSRASRVVIKGPGQQKERLRLKLDYSFLD